jgi:hypothetical protein
MVLVKIYYNGICKVLTRVFQNARGGEVQNVQLCNRPNETGTNNLDCWKEKGGSSPQLMRTASLYIKFKKSDGKASISRIWAYNTSTAMFEITITIAYGHPLFNFVIR